MKGKDGGHQIAQYLDYIVNWYCVGLVSFSFVPEVL